MYRFTEKQHYLVKFAAKFNGEFFLIMETDLNEIKQRLEDEVAAKTAALEKEEKLRKELEVLNSKLLQEKTSLLSSLEGEKGELSSFQERAAKLQAQKADLELQLQVCWIFFLYFQ